MYDIKYTGSVSIMDQIIIDSIVIFWKIRYKCFNKNTIQYIDIRLKY